MGSNRPDVSLCESRDPDSPRRRHRDSFWKFINLVVECFSPITRSFNRFFGG